MRLHDLTKTAPATLTSTVDRPATTIPELVEHINSQQKPLTRRDRYTVQVHAEVDPLLAVSIDGEGNPTSWARDEYARACLVVTARWNAAADVAIEVAS